MATETLYATSLTSGAVTTSANALGAPDGVFTTDTGTTNWTARFAMGNPTQAQPNGTHTITARVRKESGQSGTPTVDSISIYDGATSLLISTLTAGATNITSTTGQDVSGTFPASTLTGYNVNNLEVEIVTTGAGGNPSTRTPVQLDAITWSGDFTAASVNANVNATTISRSVAIAAPTVQVSGPVTVSPSAISRTVAIATPTVVAGSGSGGGTLNIAVITNATPNALDTQLINALTGAGHTVTQTSTTGPTGYDVEVYTESASGSAAGASLSHTNGVVSCEYTVVSLNMSTAAGSAGTSTNTWDLVGTNSLNTGVTDPLVALTSSAAIWAQTTAQLASGVEVLAVNAAGTTYVQAAVCDTGATLTTGNAAGRRAMFTTAAVTTAIISTEGLAYFVKLVEWAGNLSSGTNANITASTISRAVSMPAPTVVAQSPDASVSPSAITRTVTFPSPTVSGGVTLPASLPGIEPETHVRLGVIQDSNGNLYRITESDLASNNQPRMMKSSDQGQTWTEQDVTHRPGYPSTIGDLESACMTWDSASHTITLTWAAYAPFLVEFYTSDHPTNADLWNTAARLKLSAVNEESTPQYASHSSPTDQTYDWVFWSYATGSRYRTRTGASLGTQTDFDTAGLYPNAVLAPNNDTYVIYKKSGQVHYKKLTSAGTLDATSTRVDSSGAADAAGYDVPFAAPVAYTASANTVVSVLFAKANETLVCVDIVNGTPGAEQQVYSSTVAANEGGTFSLQPIINLAVDSYNTLHAIWSDGATWDVMYSSRPYGGSWTTPVTLVDVSTTAFTEIGWVTAETVTHGGTEYFAYTYDLAPHADDASNIFYNRLAISAPTTSANATPGTIARSVSIASPTVVGGTSVNAAPTTISRLVAFGANTVVGGGGATPTPATVSRLASIVTPTVNAGTSTGAAPATISRLISFGSNVVVGGSGTNTAPATISGIVSLTPPFVGAGTGPDTTPPVTIITGAYHYWESVDYYYEVTYNFDANEPSWTYQYRTGPASAWTEPLYPNEHFVTFEIPAGTLNLERYFSVRATDLEGNTDPNPPVYTFTPDNYGPVASTVAGTTSFGSPTVSVITPVVITPTTISRSASFGAPTVAAGAGSAVSPVAISRSATFDTPAIVAGASASVSSSTIGRTVSITSPTTNAGNSSGATPATISRTATIGTASARSGATATPSAISRAATMPAPSLSSTTGSSISASTISRAATFPSATVSLPVSVSGVTVSRAGILSPASVAAGTTNAPNTTSSTVSIGSPSVSAGSASNPSVGTISRSVSIGTGNTVRAGAQFVLAAAVASVVSFGGLTILSGQATNVPAQTVAAPAAVYAPSVGAGGSVFVSAQTIAGNVLIPADTLGSGSHISPAGLTRTVSLSSPVVGVSHTVAPAGIIRAVMLAGNTAHINVARSQPSIVRVVSIPAVSSHAGVAATPATVAGYSVISGQETFDWAWDAQAQFYELDPVIVENPVASIVGNETTSASIYDDESTATTFTPLADIAGNTPSADIQGVATSSADIFVTTTAQADIIDPAFFVPGDTGGAQGTSSAAITPVVIARTVSFPALTVVAGSSVPGAVSGTTISRAVVFASSTVIASRSATVSPSTISRTASLPAAAAATPSAGTLNVYMAVSSDVTPNADDVHIHDVLVAAGHTVTYGLSTTALPSTGYDVCIVTESGSASSAANTSVAACPLPVVHMETNWNTIRISSAAASSQGTGTNYTVVGGHPITAGYTGSVAIVSTSKSVYTAATTALASGVTTIMIPDGATATSSVVVAETGATLTTGTAPNRRVEISWGIVTTAPTAWTAAADTIFRQAVSWAANVSGDATVTASAIARTVSIPAPTVVGQSTSGAITPTTISRSVVVPVPAVLTEAPTAIYYVSPSGVDSASNGSFAAPWRTLTYAAGRLAAGNVLYIRGGIYQEKVRFSVSGTAAQPIKVMSYPGETAIVDGNNYTLPNTPTNSSLVVVAGDYNQISNIEVRDSLWAGLEVDGANDTVTNVTSHHNMEQGIITWGSTNAIIQDCVVHDNAFSNENGIHKFGRSTYATGLSAGGNTTTTSVGTIIRRCQVYNNWGEGLSCYNSTNTTMEDNVVYDNSKEIYISDSTDVLCQRNLIYSTPGNANNIGNSPTQHGINLQDENQAPSSARITIINNLVLGCVTNFKWYPRNGVDTGGNPVDSAMDTVLVANNTFVNSTDASQANFFIADPVNISHTGVRIDNNIILQEDAVPVGFLGAAAQTGVTFANNNWSNSPPAAMLGTGSVVADPLVTKTGTVSPGVLTGDYFKITTSSPAKDVGLTLTEVTDDYFKQARPVGSAPDIGAHEYV